jgi:hypothetical protein
VFEVDVVFQTGLCVSDVPLQITANDCHLVEAVAQRVLCGVEAFLCCRKVLISEINAAIQSIHSLVSVARDFRL